MREVKFMVEGTFLVKDDVTDDEVYDLLNGIIDSNDTVEFLDCSTWTFTDEECDS